MKLIKKIVIRCMQHLIVTCMYVCVCVFVYECMSTSVSVYVGVTERAYAHACVYV